MEMKFGLRELGFRNIKDIVIHSKDFYKGFIDAVNWKSGIISIVVWLLLLIIVNIFFISLIALFEIKSVVNAIYFNVVSSIALLAITTIGVVITASVASILAQKVFKGVADYDNTIGLMAYVVIPVFVTGLLANIVLLVTKMARGSLDPYYGWIIILLTIIAFAWIAYIATAAIHIADKINMRKSFISFLGGFIVAAVVNTPILFLFANLAVAFLRAIALI